MAVTPSPVTTECEFLLLVVEELQATRAMLEKELPAIRALLRKLQLPAVATSIAEVEWVAGESAADASNPSLRSEPRANRRTK